MKHLPTILFAILASTFAANVAACQTAPPSVRDSDAIFLGYETGERWPDSEAEYTGGRNASTVGNARGYPLFILRVVQTDRLKGNAPQTVEAISPCALPVEAGEKVSVSHRKGQYRVYPADLPGYKEAVREALRDDRQLVVQADQTVPSG